MGGATIFYATHIFDGLADWATHMLYFSKAKIATCCKMADLTEYQALVSKGTRVPLYSLIREWVNREYDVLVAEEDKESPQAPTLPGPMDEITSDLDIYAREGI